MVAEPSGGPRRHGVRALFPYGSRSQTSGHSERRRLGTPARCGTAPHRRLPRPRSHPPRRSASIPGSCPPPSKVNSARDPVLVRSAASGQRPLPQAELPQRPPRRAGSGRGRAPLLRPGCALPCAPPRARRAHTGPKAERRPPWRSPRRAGLRSRGRCPRRCREATQRSGSLARKRLERGGISAGARHSRGDADGLGEPTLSGPIERGRAVRGPKHRHTPSSNRSRRTRILAGPEH